MKLVMSAENTAGTGGDSSRIDKTEALILRPLMNTGKAFYLLAGAILALIAWFGYAWYTQLARGLVVTGMGNTPGGATWGVYITNFVHTVATASPGMTLSVMVHQLGFKKYRPIVRIGELMAVIFLTLSMLFVIFDMGRPDRILNMFTHGQAYSPLVWDLAIVTNYLVLSLVALYLPLRDDILLCIGKIRDTPRWRQRLYRLVLAGYTGTHEERVLTERVLKLVSVGILVVMVLVHTAVVPYIFGLLSGRAGWFTAFMGAYFGVAHIATGIATIIVVGIIIRALFRLDEYMELEIFQGLGKFLAALNLIYLHFMFSEQITARFAGPVAEFNISQAWLFGEQAWLFWPSVVMFVVSTLIAIAPKTRTIRGLFVSAILSITGYWIKRLIIVITSLLYPLLPYPRGEYVPTWVEWSLMAGAYILAVAAFTGFAKVFPLVELPAKQQEA